MTPARENPVQNAVDETAGVFPAVLPADVHRLVDGDLGRNHRVELHLENAESEEPTVGSGEAFQLPVIQVGPDEPVDVLEVLPHAEDPGSRKFADLPREGSLGGDLVLDVLDVLDAQVQLIDIVEGQFPPLASDSHPRAS